MSRELEPDREPRVEEVELGPEHDCVLGAEHCDACDAEELLHRVSTAFDYLEAGWPHLADLVFASTRLRVRCHCGCGL